MISTIKLFISFWIFFIIFIASSMLIYYNNQAVSDGADIAGVSTQVTPILDMITSVFQITMGIIALGLFIAMVASVVIKKQQSYGGYYGGDYYE